MSVLRNRSLGLLLALGVFCVLACSAEERAPQAAVDGGAEFGDYITFAFDEGVLTSPVNPGRTTTVPDPRFGLREVSILDDGSVVLPGADGLQLAPRDPPLPSRAGDAPADDPSLRFDGCTIALQSESGFSRLPAGGRGAVGPLALARKGRMTAWPTRGIELREDGRELLGELEGLPLDARELLGPDASLTFAGPVTARAQVSSGEALAGGIDWLLADRKLLSIESHANVDLQLQDDGGRGVVIGNAGLSRVRYLLDPCTGSSFLLVPDAPLVGKRAAKLRLFDAEGRSAAIDALGLRPLAPFATRSREALWDGEAREVQAIEAQLIARGRFPLELRDGAAMTLEGELAAAFGAGARGDALRALLRDGRLPGYGAPLRLLGEGALAVVLEVPQPLRRALGFPAELAFSVREATLYVALDPEAESPAFAAFHGEASGDAFAATLLAGAAGIDGQPLDGYVRSRNDWALAFAGRFDWFAEQRFDAQVELAVLPDEPEPRFTVAGTLDLGSLQLPQRVALELGTTALRLRYDVEREAFCEELARAAQTPAGEVQCRVRVCGDASGVTIEPTCALPSGFSCETDAECASERCELQTDVDCVQDCSRDEQGCGGECELGEAACHDLCATALSLCYGACDDAPALCTQQCTAAVRQGIDEQCDRAADLCGNTCRGGCGGQCEGCSYPLPGPIPDYDCSGDCERVCRSACAVGCDRVPDLCKMAAASIDTDACAPGCERARSVCRAQCESQSQPVCLNACANDRGHCDSDCARSLDACVQACGGHGICR